MSIRKIILPDFATKDWFRTYQLPLKFAINHPRPAKREYYRDKFGLIHLDPRISISKITPNAAHYRVEKDQIQAVIYSGNVFEWALKREFERIFYPLHKFDLQIANRFIPVLNLGYDTLTVYSAVADGRVRNYNSVWATCRNATDGDTALTNEIYNSAGISSYYFTGNSNYYIFRSWFYFDTSSIGSGTISAATLSLYGMTNNGSGVSVMKGTQAASLTTADFDAFSGSVYATVASWSKTAYNDFALDATGLSDIDKAGTTKYCAREKTKDIDNSAPTDIVPQNGCYFADYPNTTYDPKLVVTYTPASAVGARSGSVV